MPAVEVTRILNRSWPLGRSSTVTNSTVAILTLPLVGRSPASLGNAVSAPITMAAVAVDTFWPTKGLVQIRRLRSASSRARLRVPSVSAIRRLAASSVLIVSRADIILGDLATGTITAGGASGVFMVLMGIILSNECSGRQATFGGCFITGPGAPNRSIGLANQDSRPASSRRLAS
ncbi:hypothetical protein MPLSOD_280028 [Mesorhizobium sp. SOD10]|nr:hypothetical protein MPLSOD_280028 [Mesorhizobium sp. SOD10]